MYIYIYSIFHERYILEVRTETRISRFYEFHLTVKVSTDRSLVQFSLFELISFVSQEVSRRGDQRWMIYGQHGWKGTVGFYREL